MSLINSNPQIASKINDLWQKFWSGGISNPLTAIEQITYLLFMKKLDENDLEALSASEFSGDPYSSKFEGIYVLPQDRPKADATKEEIAEIEKVCGGANSNELPQRKTCLLMCSNMYFLSLKN